MLQAGFESADDSGQIVLRTRRHSQCRQAMEPESEAIIGRGRRRVNEANDDDRMTVTSLRGRPVACLEQPASAGSRASGTGPERPFSVNLGEIEREKHRSQSRMRSIVWPDNGFPWDSLDGAKLIEVACSMLILRA